MISPPPFLKIRFGKRIRCTMPYLCANLRVMLLLGGFHSFRNKSSWFRHPFS